MSRCSTCSDTGHRPGCVSAASQPYSPVLSCCHGCPDCSRGVPNPGADAAERHIVEFGDDGWAIQHPERCRPDLLACFAHRVFAAEAAEWAGPPVEPGRYHWRIHRCADGDVDRVEFFPLSQEEA